ncbi:MAG: hypothetical protein QNJ33_18380, partial [Crocosphaera sp.]|nr:hypothetical protein [Crocosphaera sp.]
MSGTVGACGTISGNPVGGAKAVVVPVVVGLADRPGFSKTGDGEFSKTGLGISGKGLLLTPLPVRVGCPVAVASPAVVVGVVVVVVGGGSGADGIGLRTGVGLGLTTGVGVKVGVGLGDGLGLSLGDGLDDGLGTGLGDGLVTGLGLEIGVATGLGIGVELTGVVVGTLGVGVDSVVGCSPSVRSGSGVWSLGGSGTRSPSFS